MKKKIITVTLAVVIAFNFLAVRPRAAAGVAAAGIALGVLAFNLIGVMSGQYDDTAEGIGCLIENGVEGWQKAFVGTDDTPSWFASGWQQIYDTCSGWFDSGDISLTDDGKVSLSYSQYLELCDLLAGTSTDLDIDLGSSVDYKFFQWDFSSSVPLVAAPKFDSFYTSVGNSFIPVLYSSDKIYICCDYWHFFLVEYNDELKFMKNSSYTTTAFESSNNTAFIDWLDDLAAFQAAKYSFSYEFNKCLNLKYYYYGNRSSDTDLRENKWFVYDGGSFEFVSTNKLETSGFESGYLVVSGYPTELLKSISKYAATKVSNIPVDDLSDVLPLDKTKNPTLEIDTDPAITNPNDAVTVKDVPGQADLTLSELKVNTRLDIDIPSMIATKFPFCIPFDLIRIMSVLGADPVAPVFRIPISTDPENLKGFEGNQTIGELPEDFEPMFEVDTELVLDLSVIPLVQPICYTVFIISFIVLLIYITPKMINH